MNFVNDISVLLPTNNEDDHDNDADIRFVDARLLLPPMDGATASTTTYDDDYERRRRRSDDRRHERAGLIHNNNNNNSDDNNNDSNNDESIATNDGSENESIRSEENNDNPNHTDPLLISSMMHHFSYQGLILMISRINFDNRGCVQQQQKQQSQQFQKYVEENDGDQHRAKNGQHNVPDSNDMATATMAHAASMMEERMSGKMHHYLPHELVVRIVTCYLTVRPIIHDDDVSVIQCSSHDGRHPLDCLLSEDESTWWLSASDSMPCGKGNEFVEFQLVPTLLASSSLLSSFTTREQQHPESEGRRRRRQRHDSDEDEVSAMEIAPSTTTSAITASNNNHQYDHPSSRRQIVRIEDNDDQLSLCRLTKVSLKIPPLPQGPLSVGLFHLERFEPHNSTHPSGTQRCRDTKRRRQCSPPSSDDDEGTSNNHSSNNNNNNPDMGAANGDDSSTVVAIDEHGTNSRHHATHENNENNDNNTDMSRCDGGGCWKVCTPTYTVANRAGWQQFDVPEPMDVDRIRLVCTANQIGRLHPDGIQSPFWGDDNLHQFLYNQVGYFSVRFAS